GSLTLPEQMLALVSAQTGKVIWKSSLGQASESFEQWTDSLFACGRLDADEVLDLVVWARPSLQTWELRALNGLTGDTLWARPVSGSPRGERLAVPTLADLDGPGQLDAVILESGQVTALNGRDGEPKWTWRSKDFRELLPHIAPDLSPTPLVVD